MGNIYSGSKHTQDRTDAESVSGTLVGVAPSGGKTKEEGSTEEK
jgi:hypothetical protein